MRVAMQQWLAADRTARPGMPLKSAPSVTDNTDERWSSDLSQACEAFEGLLIGEMLKAMRQSSAIAEGILPMGSGERIFMAQQCEALGSALAQREPLGIARLLLQSLAEPSGRLEGAER